MNSDFMGIRADETAELHSHSESSGARHLSRSPIYFIILYGYEFQAILLLLANA